ncbi:hypothetical protein GFB49_11545 [Epibacterium sp. SM1979]|uniref:YlxR domain-containing protein n=1 Tax=Tritonibacter litoralis TaxID=2662264 RepID=A0A843YCN8_9RHOB|nr:hypothetical protein [Tritonibacter litoralis]MQQ09090.1 hypothetical protein [Tritonibacter litoralis]
MRPLTPKCEVCGGLKPTRGVGFPLLRPPAPDLPHRLRGAVLWICDSTRCDRIAQMRARKAAAAEGVELTTFDRVHIVTP